MNWRLKNNGRKETADLSMIFELCALCMYYYRIKKLINNNFKRKMMKSIHEGIEK